MSKIGWEGNYWQKWSSEVTTRIFVFTDAEKREQFLQKTWAELLPTFFCVGMLHGWNIIVFFFAHVFYVSSVEMPTQIKIVGRKYISSHEKNVGKEVFLPTIIIMSAKIDFLATKKMSGERYFYPWSSWRRQK